jgi:PAS domain S-box-containing protein
MGPDAVAQGQRRLLDTAPVLIWQSGTDGKCIWFNSTWLAFTGRSLEQELGDGWADGVHPDDLGPCLAIYVEAFAARRRFSMEYRLRRHDGTYGWIVDHGQPLHGPDGSFVGYIGYCFDISDHRQADLVLAERSRELEATNAALAASNAELEQFAYVASHDLREPLRMISSYLSLLERRYGELLDQDGHDFLFFARDGALRMDRLVMDLLEFSRIDRRGNPIVAMPLGEALFMVAHHLSVAIGESGARLDIPEDNAPTILGDASQISRLFQNVIGNAIKYRAADRVPEIRVSWRRLGAEWEFAVADNGIGIETQYFDRIFGIFQRLHTRDKYEGTGIGLAVCKKIVERHRGRIWLTSEPGVGSTFFFTLPAAPEE